MKIALYSFYYLHLVKDYFEKDGHKVISNRITSDTDICIVENRFFMYDIYKNLKFIKKNNIKLINIVADIPIWRLQKNLYHNTTKKTIKQILFNLSKRFTSLSNLINTIKPDPESIRLYNFISNAIQNYTRRSYGNRFYYQKNYRRFLKQSDLILSISKYTQYCVKRFLKLETLLCYQCVNSDYLLTLPKVGIKYDAINISRVVPLKRQNVFVDAAKRLGLKILVLGKHFDKAVKLDCPHYYFPDMKNVFNVLNQSNFYVDASLFEGFGMTPVEAAFIEKPVIASDTYVHREILGDYALFFKRDNVSDLVEKMKVVMEEGIKLNNEEIKKKYSSKALKNRLMEYLESLI